jgi:hypothetical protein
MKIDQVGGNCLISAATCALKELGRSSWNPDLLHELLLDKTRNHHLAVVLRTIQEDTGLGFGIEFHETEMELRSNLSRNLDSGSLCKLSVNSQRYLNTLLGLGKNNISADSLHAVLIFGYYQPEGDEGPMWLFLTDSFSRRQHFISFDDFIKTVDDNMTLGYDMGVFFSVDEGEVWSFSWWEKLRLRVSGDWDMVQRAKKQREKLISKK